MLVNWLAEKPEKKIKARQKLIDGLNKVLQTIARDEKCYLDEAATELENATGYGGIYKSVHLERKKIAEQMAKQFTDMRPPVLKRLVLLESLNKREIEALQDATLTNAQKRTPFCFFF